MRDAKVRGKLYTTWFTEWFRFFKSENDSTEICNNYKIKIISNQKVENLYTTYMLQLLRCRVDCYNQKFKKLSSLWDSLMIVKLVGGNLNLNESIIMFVYGDGRNPLFWYSNESFGNSQKEHLYYLFLFFFYKKFWKIKITLRAT